MLSYILGFVALYFLTYLLITYLEEEYEDEYAQEGPFVTILIPAYNESATISDTIRSALALDYPGFEVIVIDDGSTDDTHEKAAGCDVQVVKQANQGKAAALNYGISLAKGELIATLDADSYVDSEALRYMVAYFKDPKVMAVTPTMKVMGKGILANMQKSEYMLSNLMSKIFSLMDSVLVTPGPFSVYRASVFRSLGGFDGSTLTEDNDMALRIQGADFRIRSSKNAIVCTNVPQNLGALFRQRKRWYTGYIENLVKHARLFGPRYGELGALVLPATTLLLLLSLARIVMDGYYALQSLSQGSAPYTIPLISSPFEILSIIAFAIGLLLFYFSILEAKEKPGFQMFVHLALISLLSPILYVHAFFRRAYEKITRRAAKW